MYRHKTKSDIYRSRTWTTEQDQIILSMLEQKKSGSMIADVLGKTRCSVIGRIWRMKKAGVIKVEKDVD